MCLQGVYGDNGSFVYHVSFGYAPQVPYGPYSLAGTLVPTMGADGMLYGPQPFQYTGPFYQQPVPPGAQYIHPPTPPLPGFCIQFTHLLLLRIFWSSFFTTRPSSILRIVSKDCLSSIKPVTFLKSDL